MQLEEAQGSGCYQFVDSFNSILVQLEGRKSQKPKRRVCKFQFHIGAIRRKATTKKLRRTCEFQFHIGAIRRRVRQYAGVVKTCFNSILVQLEELVRVVF